MATLTVSNIDNPVAAFRQVMVDNSGEIQIAFARTTSAGNTCTTNDNPSVPLVARITCYTDNHFTEFTAVHELGHIFIDRTGNSLTDDHLDDPSLKEKDRHPDPEERLVIFGYILRPENGNWLSDWDRGPWGWGTGAEVLSDDISIRTVGACESSTATPPTAFQQNPCQVKDWRAIGDEKGTEIEETAADMFLNWVYWSIEVSDPISQNTGFENIRWSSPTQGTEDNIRLPGDVRSDWMNQTMIELFNNLGW